MVELNQEDSNYTQIDQRASWFYGPSEKHFDKTWSMEDIVEIR